MISAFMFSQWVGIETLLLLFCMLVFVGILSETGIFDYLILVCDKIFKFATPLTLVHIGCVHV